MMKVYFYRNPDPEQGPSNEREESNTESIEAILAKLDEAAGLDDELKMKMEKTNKLKETLKSLWDPYNEKRKAYENATLEYNDLRMKALSGTDSDAVMNFSVNAPLLRNRVSTALNDWIQNGYKNEVEVILNRIDLITKKNG